MLAGRTGARAERASANEAARSFYARRGYVEDETSPGQCLDAAEAATHPHAILARPTDLPNS